MGKKEWDEAATAVAKAVVSVMPQLNEYKIKARVFAFFASEDEYSQSVYNDSNFYYTDDVVSILEKAFDNADDESSMVAAVDFRWAFDQLSDSYQYRILERYQHSVIRPADSAERAQLNRAVRKLADILNTWNRTYDYEGTGSRKVISNATAAARVAANDSGDSDDKTRFRFDGGDI